MPVTLRLEKGNKFTLIYNGNQVGYVRLADTGLVWNAYLSRGISYEQLEPCDSSSAAVQQLTVHWMESVITETGEALDQLGISRPMTTNRERNLRLAAQRKVTELERKIADLELERKTLLAEAHVNRLTGDSNA